MSTPDIETPDKEPYHPVPTESKLGKQLRKHPQLGLKWDPVRRLEVSIFAQKMILFITEIIVLIQTNETDIVQKYLVKNQ